MGDKNDKDMAVLGIIGIWGYLEGRCSVARVLIVLEPLDKETHSYALNTICNTLNARFGN